MLVADSPDLDVRLCAPIAPDELAVCLQLREEGTWRWVNEAELATWGRARADVLRRVFRKSRAHLRSSGAFVHVEGMEHQYWLADRGDGWAAAAVLHPDRLARLLGTTDLRVAVPNQEVLLAWGGGSAELDLVMAVGASDMHAVQRDPVSPTVFRFDGRGWTPWATARPAVSPRP